MELEKEKEEIIFLEKLNSVPFGYLPYLIDNLINMIGILII